MLTMRCPLTFARGISQDCTAAKEDRAVDQRHAQLEAPVPKRKMH